MKLLSKTYAVLAISSSLSTALLGIDSLETAYESLRSDSVSINLFTAKAGHELGKWTLRTTLARSDYDIDFQPASFDFLGEEAQVTEKTHSLNFTAARELADALTLDLGAGYRDGFPNYRSAWLDTYFDQHFAPLEGVAGHDLYQDFQANAASVSAGLRWEYVPANAIASVLVSRIQDNVSPGYEIDFDGIARGELVLVTSSISLVTENVLSPRLRSRFALTATETSARNARYSAELSLNAALGERFVWRNRLGAATESPLFDANFFDTALEFQATDSLSVYIQGRHYEDTGEIENALLFTTAAPELDNDSIGLGLRYHAAAWSAKVAITRSESDFAATNLNVDFFQNLYLDDTWTRLELAFAKSF